MVSDVVFVVFVLRLTQGPSQHPFNSWLSSVCGAPQCYVCHCVIDRPMEDPLSLEVQHLLADCAAQSSMDWLVIRKGELSDSSEDECFPSPIPSKPSSRSITPPMIRKGELSEDGSNVSSRSIMPVPNNSLETDRCAVCLNLVCFVC